MSSRVATDIGGTFTDLVQLDESGELSFAKSSTTPSDLAQGVLDVIERGGVALADVAALAHGTTVVINTLTERTGAGRCLLGAHHSPQRPNSLPRRLTAQLPQRPPIGENQTRPVPGTRRAARPRPSPAPRHKPPPAQTGFDFV